MNMNSVKTVLTEYADRSLPYNMVIKCIAVYVFA